MPIFMNLCHYSKIPTSFRKICLKTLIFRFKQDLRRIPLKLLFFRVAPVAKERER